MRIKEAKDRIIVALDVPSLVKVGELIEKLSPHVGCFKIGLELITAVGPSAIDFVHDKGGKVFYDAKFNDIPNTMAGAARGLAAKNVMMFNLMASAGIDGMLAAVSNKGNSLVLAVTVLTSFDEENANATFDAPSKVRVLRFARDAKLAGVDGVICSPQELAMLNARPELKGLLKITPGVRPAGADVGDQKRVDTPGSAIAAGADYLVIGRPITKADDPVAAAIKISDKIAREMQQMNPSGDIPPH